MTRDRGACRSIAELDAKSSGAAEPAHTAEWQVEPDRRTHRPLDGAFDGTVCLGFARTADRLITVLAEVLPEQVTVIDCGDVERTCQADVGI
jgi:hypothetical protein